MIDTKDTNKPAQAGTEVYNPNLDDWELDASKVCQIGDLECESCQ